MLNRYTAIIVCVAGAVLLAGGTLAWAQNGAVSPTDPKHFNPRHRCDYCHIAHKAPAPNNVQDRVQENICRRCHTASQVLEWKASGLISQPTDVLPPTTRRPFIDPMQRQRQIPRLRTFR